MNRMPKRFTRNIIKSTKGVISILLCLLVTPFLTLACGLVELSRYQSTEETLQGIINCASMSTLSNYDTYLQERFGILALSQNINVSDTFQKNLSDNMNLVGGGISSSSISASGKYALSDQAMLKAQLRDYAEGTIPIEMVLDQLTLNDVFDSIMKKLLGGDGYKKFEKISGTIDAGEKILKVVEKAVELIDKLKNHHDGIKKAYETFKTDYNDFCKSILSFLQKLKDDDVYDGTNLSDIIDDDNYNLYIVNICKAADKLSKDDGAIHELKSKISTTEMYGDISDIVDSFGEAKDAIDELRDGDTELDTYKVLVDSIAEAFAGAATQFTTQTFDNCNTLLGSLENNLKTFFVPDSLSSRLESIGSADDFTDDEKNTFNTYFSQEVMPFYNVFFPDDGSIPYSYDVMLESISVNFRNIGGTEINVLIDNILKNEDEFVKLMNEASGDFKQNSADAFTGFLDTIRNVVEGLFDLHIYYDPDLDAVLSKDCYAALSSDMSNPYQTLLDAVDTLTTAVTSLGSNIVSLNIVDFFKNCAAIWDAAKKLLEFVVQKIEATVKKFGEICGSFSGGLPGALSNMYDTIMLNGYYVYNLPNRTCSGEVESKLDIKTGTYKDRRKLEGDGITGFSYDNIVSPWSDVVGINSPTSEFGNDRMFKGAELEYMIGGTSNEMFNQTVSFMELYFMRLVLDLIPLFKPGSSASTIASSAGMFSVLVYVLIAIADPYLDTIILVNGGEVPLIKSQCYISPLGVGTLLDQLVGVTIGNADLEKSIKEDLKKELGGSSGGSSGNSGSGVSNGNKGSNVSDESSESSEGISLKKPDNNQTSNNTTKPDNNKTSNNTTKPDNNKTSNNTTKPDNNQTSNNTTKPDNNKTSNNTTKPDNNKTSNNTTKPDNNKTSNNTTKPDNNKTSNNTTKPDNNKTTNNTNPNNKKPNNTKPDNNKPGANNGKDILNLDYKTHMFLVLLLTSATEDDKLTRLGNIIQLECDAYYKEQGQTNDFSTSKAFTTIETNSTITFNSFLSVFTINDPSIMTKEYKQTRSY